MERYIVTQILDIKADKNFPYHYIVSVGCYSGINEPRTGQFYLKYKVVSFTHDDIEKVRSAIMLGSDQLFKTNMKDAMNLCECNELVSTLSSLKFACRANIISMHHFSSEYEIDEDWFKNIVENAHRIESYRKLLQESLMK
jgi:hypothetical protein